MALGTALATEILGKCAEIGYPDASDEVICGNVRASEGRRSHYSTPLSRIWWECAIGCGQVFLATTSLTVLDDPVLPNVCDVPPSTGCIYDESWRGD